MSEKTGLGRYVNFRRLELFVLYPLSGMIVSAMLALWLVPAFKGFRLAREKGAQLRPLLEQARADRINYAQAAAADAPTGKYVLWCVQNRGETGVSVDGDGNKPLFVSNYGRMPLYSGSKHQACTPMLLLLENRAPGRPVTVFFKEAL